MNAISRLYASPLSAPMRAIIFFESRCTGNFEMSSLKALSGGNTWRAARILSASGVLNITGLVMSGIFGPPANGVAADPRRRQIATVRDRRGLCLLISETLHRR